MDKYRRTLALMLFAGTLFAGAAGAAAAAPAAPPEGGAGRGPGMDAPPRRLERGEHKEEREHDRIRRMVRSGELLPLERILQKAQARRPGEVIEVDLEHEHGQLVYEVEILDAGGVVRKLYFDARSGEPLPSPDGD